MGEFAWGLVVGWLTAMVVAAGAGFFIYRHARRLEQRARQAERLAELGTLTGGLAHEIKNPLSTIQLNLQLLKEDLTAEHDDTEQTRLLSRLGVVQRETSRLRDILDDFLRYAGRLELDRLRTDLNQLVEELVDFFSPQAQSQQVRLRLHRCEGELTAEVDSRLLKQALLNLMLNGLQATPAGGELMLTTQRSGGEAIISVIDTGPGIPPDQQQRIFDAYYTRRKGGTGLGLSIARRTVQEHGGQMTLQSEPGKGSCFALHLPMA